ncbi:MAG TPA: phage portal protein, partial [Sedimentisphaerales bacterium]|nr:phage portal protein [Sedimentisphaerales bacterium]
MRWLNRIWKRLTAHEADLHHWHEMYPWLETVSGERVTPATAMGIAAFFACVRNISEDVAKLPVHTYRREEKKRTEIDTPVHYLLNVEANPEMSAMSFRETLTAHAAAFGNGYAEIEWNRRVEPIAFWPLDPTTVALKREAGRLYYEVRVDGVATPVMPYDMIHIHGLGDMGLSGYQIPHLAREALGAILASQKFAAAFFGNGTWLGGVLQHPAKLGDKALQHLRETWVDRHGGAANAMKPAILEEGMTYNQLGIAPEQAQFLETRQFGVEEVCRWFRMPPHKVQHLLRATFSNIEQQALEYVGDCLMPWLIRWEQEMKRKLFSVYTQKNVYLKHNVTALLRADSAARQSYYASMIQNGAYSINDVRELEDMNPIPNGDKHYHQSNMIEVGEKPEPPKPPPAPIKEPDGDEEPPPGGEGEDEDERMLRGHRAALIDAYARVLRVESDKAQRANRKGNLEAWSAEFYPGHLTHVEGVLA